VDGGPDGCHRLARLGFRTQKKRTGRYSAKRAAIGARTLKTGQSRFFLGYKKHSFRLWLPQYERGVLLVPIVSWAAPANTNEGCLLVPSVRHCWRRWQWRPDVIVGDMGYIDAASKRAIRECWQAAVVTRLKENMLLVPPFETATHAICPQGQRLQWLGYDGEDQRQWFGVRDAQPLCGRCWQASECPREFGFLAADHETLLGVVPMNTVVSQRLLQQVRPWIEPAQSYEKNQLGLSQVFLNSLRLTWSMCLLADACVLLRASVLVRHPERIAVLGELAPRQLNLNFLE
jgi:hypothetical protein